MKPVLLLGLAPLAAPELFASLPTPQPGATNAAMTQALAITDAAAKVYSQEPRYSSLIAEGCAQVNALQMSHGVMPEPEWYAVLCVMAHTQDGETLAHEWSSGDQRYSYDDTTQKLEHARRDSGPTTCARFESLNALRCLQCPHKGKITSPIQLGKSVQPLPTERPKLDTALPRLPFPYRWSQHSAIICDLPDANDIVSATTVYKSPLYVTGFRRSESLNGRTLALEHWLPKDGWQKSQIEWDTIDSKTVMGRMAKLGINVHPQASKFFMDYMQKSIDEYQNANATGVAYDQFGWKDDFSGFLLGDELYRRDMGEPVIVGLGEDADRRAVYMTEKGTIEDWRAAAEKLLAPGYEGQAFHLLASFAAPLMKMRLNAGGTIVASVSRESGRGKTLGLTAAYSVWGDKFACEINRADTMNSRFRTISMLSNLPVIFDEMRNRDPEVLKDFVLSFSDGREKMRLGQDGVTRRHSSGWSTVLLAASNISIAETVSSDGEQAHAARILEYTASLPPDAIASEGKKIEYALLANRGVAGREFIYRLMTSDAISWAQAQTQAYEHKYETMIAGGTTTRFYPALLACIHTAADLLNHWGLLHFQTQRFIDFGIEAAQTMRENLAKLDIPATEYFSRFVNENWKNCLILTDQWRPKHNPVVRQQPTGSLVMRYEMAPNLLYVDRIVLRQWCQRNKVNYSDLEHGLKKLGVILDADAKRNLGAGTQYSAGGQVGVWQCNVAGPEFNDLRLVPEAGQPPQVRRA